MCDRVGVLYAGKLVEEGTTAAVLSRPAHPYTARLLRCLPAAGRRKRDGPLESIPGFLPSPGPLPPGCVFAPRCAFVDDTCRTLDPPMVGDRGHIAFCHHPGLTAAPAEAVPAPASQAGKTVLHAEGVWKRFGGATVLKDVSLTLEAGQTLGLVGESGSGKTTLARVLLGLIPPDPGSVIKRDGPLAATARARSWADRKALQAVFQNPDSALNRAHTVRHLIARPLARLAGLRGAALETRLTSLLAAVRLTPGHLKMRPAQLSGGLKQRVAIARAFAGDPRVVICDEPTSALDVSVQAAILNLLVDLQQREGVSFLFISHDLGVVRYLADRIAVMYRGRIVEIGPAEAVFAGPHHPYTAALLSAVPAAGHKRAPLLDGPPGPDAGCVFSGRCPRKLGAICETEPPPFAEQDGHAIRCHIPGNALDAW
jgi:peptide/nickel transport system ATP-binding protein